MLQQASPQHKGLAIPDVSLTKLQQLVEGGGSYICVASIQHFSLAVNPGCNLAIHDQLGKFLLKGTAYARERAAQGLQHWLGNVCN
jgi:hypothetical protein